MPNDAAVGWALALWLLAASLIYLYGSLKLAVPTYLRFRGGRRLVTCPENHRPAAVVVSALDAAASATLGRRRLQLKACSRWPEKKGCGQQCLSQVEAAPADCLVRTMLNRWYLGKSCVYCRKPFGVIRWHDDKPAFLGGDGRTRRWDEVTPEALPQVLAFDRPVCWNCHVAETFRREHPGLVVDRPWRGGERGGRRAH